MDAALFVPTGVMGNQLAIKCHTQPGDEVIVESESHILNYETAAPSVISNVQLLPVKGDMGIMNVEDIAKVVRTSEYYFPVTRLICLENTHNREGGVIQPIDTIKKPLNLLKLNNIKLHLDGARIFNAIAETGISLKDYADHFDSISFCFSKGLGDPVGSIVCGNKNFIEHARKWRKILGGGMRQVGILAAAALFALKIMLTV
ncbi:MAG: threonine aldolase family protein [Ignavibacteria bacterium]